MLHGCTTPSVPPMGTEREGDEIISPVQGSNFSLLASVGMRDKLIRVSSAEWDLNDAAGGATGRKGQLEVCMWTHLVLERHYSEQTSPGNPLITIVRLSRFPTGSSSGAIWSPGLSLKGTDIVTGSLPDPTSYPNQRSAEGTWGGDRLESQTILLGNRDLICALWAG